MDKSTSLEYYVGYCPARMHLVVKIPDEKRINHILQTTETGTEPIKNNWHIVHKMPLP